MVPKALFSKAKQTMIVILLITFLSGGNYFVMLLFWPTQVYNVYGESRLPNAHYHILTTIQATTLSALVFAPSPSVLASSVAPSSAFCSSQSPKAASAH